MANIERGYCPRCKKITEFYHVDPEFWECDDCGYEVDEPDTYEPMSEDEFEENSDWEEDEYEEIEEGDEEQEDE